MLKEEQIYHLIRSNEGVYWKLFLRENSYAKGQSIANYNGDNLPKDVTNEARIESAIEALKNQLSIYKDVPGISFQITMRNAKTASGDSILGPFNFIINDVNPEMPLGNVPGQMQLMNSGMVPKSQMESMLEIVTLKSTLQMERALFEREKREFEEDKKLAENELREQQKEYSKLFNAAKYGSQKGISEAIIRVGKSLGWFDDETNLGDIDKEEKNHGREDTPEENAAMKVAELLVEKKLPVTDINNIYELVVKLIEKKNGTNIQEED